MLKRETRVLGLSCVSVHSRMIVVSVVFRGAMWLDGVSSSAIEVSEQSFILIASNLIKNCRQFSQLHAILIRLRTVQNREISIQSLARRVKLPVIAITEPGRRLTAENQELNSFDISLRGKHVTIFAAGVEKGEAEELYKIGCSPYGMVPEAVRIADLLTEELNRSFSQNRKGHKVTVRTRLETINSSKHEE